MRKNKTSWVVCGLDLLERACRKNQSQKMDKYKIPVEGEHFYPGACHVCGAYGANVKLKRCGNCRSIAYCSQQHQRQHWNDHKPLCRILARKLREFGTLHLMGECMEEEDCLHRVKKELYSEVQRSLNEIGHKLANYEVEMLFRPRSCETCDNPDIFQLKDCTECPDASFCERHPLLDDEHGTKCKTSRHCFAVNCASSTFGNILLSLEHEMEFPNKMTDIIGTFASNCHVKMMFESDKIWATILTHRLSKPYTFWFAKGKLVRRKLRRMTVHVVVTRVDAMDNQYFWHYLLHHDRHLRELNIVFIGPGLSNGPLELPLCDNCIRKNCKIDFQGVGSSYPVFAASEFFIKPNYVIGYDWQIAKYRQILLPAIVSLAHLRCPLIVTSLTHRTPKVNQQEIDKVLLKKVIPSWSGDNPFASWRPVKDLATGEFTYDNEYLTIYEKLW